MKTILEKITEDKELSKRLNSEHHYSADQFSADAKTYISAIRQGRMFCVIHSVSSSGMSRIISFHSCERGKSRFWFRRYVCLFRVLGFSEVRNTGNFRIGGCGMDMIFHTNYTIIHRLHRLGFMNKKDLAHLCQQTPTYYY